MQTNPQPTQLFPSYANSVLSSQSSTEDDFNLAALLEALPYNHYVKQLGAPGNTIQGNPYLSLEIKHLLESAMDGKTPNPAVVMHLVLSLSSLDSTIDELSKKIVADPKLLEEHPDLILLINKLKFIDKYRIKILDHLANEIKSYDIRIGKNLDGESVLPDSALVIYLTHYLTHIHQHEKLTDEEKEICEEIIGSCVTVSIGKATDNSLDIQSPSSSLNNIDSPKHRQQIVKESALIVRNVINSEGILPSELNKLNISIDPKKLAPFFKVFDRLDEIKREVLANPKLTEIDKDKTIRKKQYQYLFNKSGKLTSAGQEFFNGIFLYETTFKEVFSDNGLPLDSINFAIEPIKKSMTEALKANAGHRKAESLSCVIDKNVLNLTPNMANISQGVQDTTGSVMARYKAAVRIEKIKLVLSAAIAAISTVLTVLAFGSLSHVTTFYHTLPNQASPIYSLVTQSSQFAHNAQSIAATGAALVAASSITSGTDLYSSHKPTDITNEVKTKRMLEVPDINLDNLHSANEHPISHTSYTNPLHSPSLPTIEVGINIQPQQKPHSAGSSVPHEDSRNNSSNGNSIV